jgi:uncharacterized protein
MKFVVLVAAVLALVWLLRGLGRRRVPPPERNATAQAPEVQPMLACAHCGVLVPSSEALPGRGGVFCGQAHRDAFEGPAPPP